MSIATFVSSEAHGQKICLEMSHGPAALHVLIVLSDLHTHVGGHVHKSCSTRQQVIQSCSLLRFLCFFSVLFYTLPHSSRVISFKVFLQSLPVLSFCFLNVISRHHNRKHQGQVLQSGHEDWARPGHLSMASIQDICKWSSEEQYCQCIFFYGDFRVLMCCCIFI